ncbi:MAG: hypothetical protein ACTMIR_06960 [Cellulomonadaceae bacterium]
MRTRRAGLLATTATIGLLLAGCGGSGTETGDPEADAVLEEAAASDAEKGTAEHLYRPAEDVDLEPVADAVLHLPNGDLALVGRGVAAEALSDAVLNPKTFSAPEGLVFHVFEFTGADGLSEDVVLRAGSQEWPVTTGVLERGIALLAAPGETVSLDLVHFDVAQTLDLSTGERTSVGVGEDWYSGEELVAPERDLSTIVDSAFGTLDWTARIDSVERVPFDFEFGGWVDDGAGSWISVAIADVEWTKHDDAYWGNPRYDASATLTDADGVTYEPTDTTRRGLDGEYSWVFAVPSGGTEYELTITDGVRLTMHADPTNTDEPDAVVTVPLVTEPSA